MGHRARQRSGVDRVAEPRAATRSVGPAAVLALQRRIGNAATGRILARDPPPKTDPLAKFRPVEPDKPLDLPKQWTNPHLLKSIYPGREAMFRKFVAIFRELELAAGAGKAARDKVRSESEALSGAALQGEVDRLLAGTVVPDWLKDQVRDYAGMRYFRDPKTDEGRHGAHRTYYSARRLLYIVKREEGDWTVARAQERKAAQEALDGWKAAPSKTAEDRRKRGPAPPAPPAPSAMSKAEQAWLQMSEDNAMSRLVQMHDPKALAPIPDWAFHKIVRLTPLRSRFAKADWEDLSKEKPPPDDTYWIKVMTAWTGEERIGSDYGGGTQWRPETLDEERQVAAAMVCNEISEATQRKRGIRLPGGIRKNAEYFAAKALEGAQPGAKPEIAGSYLKRLTSSADLRPGASLFWINSVWTPQPKKGEIDNSNLVFPIDGLDLPVPFPPEYVAAWKGWDTQRKAKAAWDAKRARLTWDPKLKDHSRELTEKQEQQLGPDPGEADDEPKFELTTLPADGDEVDGWTYTVKKGQGISREQDTAKHWMTWLHQATVLKAMDDGRVFVFETTLLDPKDRDSGVTGFTEHSMTAKDLLNGFVLVGFMPGVVARP